MTNHPENHRELEQLKGELAAAQKEAEDLKLERDALISDASDDLQVSHTMALINRRAECYAIIERLDKDLGQYRTKVDELHEQAFQQQKSLEEAVALAAYRTAQLAQDQKRLAECELVIEAVWEAQEYHRKGWYDAGKSLALMTMPLPEKRTP